MRYDWIDTAKGWAIIMVVFAHTMSWIGLSDDRYPFLETVHDFVSTARAPVFFCVSGLFAGKVIAASWSELYRRRIAPFLWVFLVWQVVVFGYKLVGDMVLGGGEPMSLIGHIGRAALFPFRPNGELWYLWAAILFFIAAKLLRKVRPAVIISVSALLSVGWTAAELVMPSSLVDLLGVGWNGLFTFAVFFFLGTFYREQILTFAVGAGKRGALVAALAWAAVVTVSLLLGAKHAPVFELATYAFGLVAALTVSAQFLTKPSIISRIGEKWTLPVFVTHTTIVVAIGSVLRMAGYTFTPDSILSNVIPFAVVAVAVAAGVGIGKAAKGSRMSWLFDAPRWFYFDKSRQPA